MSQYNVFISWSLEPSKSVAFVVKRWLKQVIQASNAFMSEADIESGDVGLAAIADQLEAIKVGVFCVTSANKNRPWLNYEAGAISKGRRGNKVIPLLFDIEEGVNLQPPLGQFQYKSLFKRADMEKFISDVARDLEANLKPDELADAFDSRWDQFQEHLQAIKEQHGPSATETPRSDGEKLDELLTLMRGFSSELATLRRELLPTPEFGDSRVSRSMRFHRSPGRRVRNRSISAPTVLESIVQLPDGPLKEELLRDLRDDGSEHAWIDYLDRTIADQKAAETQESKTEGLDLASDDDDSVD